MLKALLDIILPARCHFCREYIPDAGDIHLCARCLESCRTVASPQCRRCGIPFVTTLGDDHTCGECLRDSPAFTSARAASIFEGPVRELIHRLKYNRRIHHRLPLALFAARRLAPFVGETSPDLVVPVPLHVKRLRQRGFNQSVLLGEIMAREWRLPMLRRNLRRIRWTEPQINLSASERVANVRGAFRVAAPEEIRDRRIILVDDVYTTGSTAAECSRELFRSGAAEVFVVTVARALQ